MAISLKHINSDAIIHKECPIKKSSLVRIVDLFDEGILFADDNPQKKYSVNALTMAILDLVDGNHTSVEIAREIATVGEVNLVEIEDDIYELLASLQKLGFVEEVRELPKL